MSIVTGTDDMAELEGPALPAHLYVHVPFCASKCAYCDFYSTTDADSGLREAVFRAIRAEIKGWSVASLPGVIESVYFGGGTPSSAASEVVETLDYIRQQFVTHAACEITVEGNPDSLDSSVVSVLAGSGVTRVSVGVQAFDDSVLRLLGRRHDANAADRACRRVVDAGMALSADLICGVPGQSMASWTETLERACDTGARHVSVYPLSIEEGTALDAAVSAGLVADVDPDVQAEMMSVAEALLARRGLTRYEVANYAASQADRSRHNTAYWTGASYIGVGPAAHGMVDAHTARVMGLGGGSPETARVRYGNAPSIEDWLTGKCETREELSAAEALREDVMLGLRLTAGVRAEEVARAGVTDVLESLQSEGLVELVDRMWRTTRRGWLLGNEVFGRVWSAEP